MLQKQNSEKTGVDAIVEGLSKAIHEHRLLPGAKLIEDEIGGIYGVSRTTVRAALQKLAHDQLLLVERNRGAFVARPDPREAKEVFEARSLLEPRTARSATERMTKRAISDLGLHIQEEHAAFASGDLGKALRASGQFHIEIANIADQTTITRFIESLVARSSLIIALYWRRQGALCESHAHHALMDAFRNGDAMLAEELMQSHVVDLASALDYSVKNDEPLSLKQILLNKD